MQLLSSTVNPRLSVDLSKVHANSSQMAELEKLGPKYRIALRIARDERFERLRCDHKGVYADDWYVLVLSLMWESLDTWFLETEDIVKW